MAQRKTGGAGRQQDRRAGRRFKSAGPPGASKRPNPLKGVHIYLDDERFDCKGDMNLLDLSELSMLAMSAMDTRSPQGIAMVAQFLQLAFGPTEYLRFKSHVREHDTHDDTVFEVLQEITGEIGLFTEQATGRPTAPPTSSSGGRSDREQALSRVISLDKGEVLVVEPDQVPGAQTG